ncbi:hypothetical protein KAR91_38805 [Candidatus Pacearchaeota archaeon]|nr:hypothetical protein [Candidatus Pacearchaeota archaeon]
MRGKKGQVTIFVITALVIVILAIIFYLMYPQIKSTLGLESKNPNQFIQDCMEEQIREARDKVSAQGGSIDPEHYFLYKDEKLKYLCYTEEYYQMCIVQEPLLKGRIEDEIKKEISEGVRACFDDLESTFKGKGYDVNLREGPFEVELLPRRIVAKFNTSLTLTKDSSEEYDSFSVVVNDNLYELVSIATSIISSETRFGDSESTVYMNYYHDLKVEKLKQSDGTTVYILTNRDTKNKFQFASRSLAWPPGFE